ncbi:MAG: hypothetical protein JWR62_1908 [Modestobacter sp.]|nr:hypothetical protein [Modestobacter sp.]
MPAEMGWPRPDVIIEGEVLEVDPPDGSCRLTRTRQTVEGHDGVRTLLQGGDVALDSALPADEPARSVGRTAGRLADLLGD